MKKEYVLGFVIVDGAVCLIRKARPEWQAGKLNGIGGKIEPGEHPLDAIVREFKEETGANIYQEQWHYFCMLEGGDWRVHCYVAWPNAILTRSMTDESVDWYAVRALDDLEVIPNLRWLIPLALDPETPVVHSTQK